MKATEKIYAHLRKRLMTGYYAPGIQLKEGDLAAEFSLSRTPVRSALAQLVSQGLLMAQANRGVFVAEWTDQDLQEVFALRRLLESQAAGWAALRRTDEQLEKLTMINSEMRAAAGRLQAPAIQEVQSKNNSFHRAILRASASPRLIGICDALVDTPMIIGSFYLYDAQEMARSLDQHDEILRAISLQDFAYASDAMSLHLKSTYETYRSKRSSRRA